MSQFGCAPAPRDRPPRALLWRASCTALLLFLYVGTGVFDHDLWTPTEPAVAGATWEMLETGDLAIPRINGMPYLEKPPLTYELSWAACRLGGEISAGLLRLPEAMLGLLALACLFATLRRFHGERIAWICTLLCAVEGSFYAIMHFASSDALVIFFTFLCFSLFARTLDDRWVARTWSREDLLFSVALAASFFAKNFFAPFVVAIPIAIFLAITRQFRRLLAIGVQSLAALTLLLSPWVVALYREGGSEFLRIVFFDNTIGRFIAMAVPASRALGPLNDAYYVHKDAPPLLFAGSLLLHMLPWLLIQGAALVVVVRTRSVPRRLFSLVALAAIVGAVALSSSQVSNYFLPVLFPLQLVTAEFLHDLFAEGTAAATWKRRAVSLNFAAVALLAVTAPLVGAWMLAAPDLAWMLVPGVAATWLLARRFHAQWTTPAAIEAAAFAVAALFALDLHLAVPHVDERNSWRPFFEAIGPDAAGLRLFTTMFDDRRLPAMNFHLRRRLEYVPGDEHTVELLRSTPGVGIIAKVGQVERIRASLADIPHRELRTSAGPDLFVFLARP